MACSKHKGKKKKKKMTGGAKLASYLKSAWWNSAPSKSKGVLSGNVDDLHKRTTELVKARKQRDNLGVNTWEQAKLHNAGRFNSDLFNRAKETEKLLKGVHTIKHP